MEQSPFEYLTVAQLVKLPEFLETEVSLFVFISIRAARPTHTAILSVPHCASYNMWSFTSFVMCDLEIGGIIYIHQIIGK